MSPRRGGLAEQRKGIAIQRRQPICGGWAKTKLADEEGASGCRPAGYG